MINAPKLPTIPNRIATASNILLNAQKAFSIASRLPQIPDVFTTTVSHLNLMPSALTHLNDAIRVNQLIEKYIRELPKNLLTIAEHGWYIEESCDARLPQRLVSKLNNDDLNSFTQILTEHYLSNIDRIFIELVQRHPNRRTIFQQAKSTFEANNHNTFIPTILAQIDGIANDSTGKKFFMKDRKNNFLPEVTKEFIISSEHIWDSYLYPIMHQTPIIARERDLVNFACTLNRHEILHGINTNYGTLTNSLKVISLLKYLSDLLIRLNNK